MLTIAGICLVLLGGALVGGAVAPLSLPQPHRPPLPRALRLRREELDRSRATQLWERAVLYLTPRIQSAPWALSWAKALEPHLKRLAYPYGLLAQEWVATSLLLSAFIGMGVFLLFFSFFGVILGVAAGGLYPYLWLRSQARAEERRILRDFPDFLDTVALLLEAGLDLASSIERFSQSARESTLSRHLNQAVVDLKAGSRLIEVLAHLEEALAIEELKGFFATVRESVRSGGALVPVFRVQADTLRQRRFERAEKQAMEATVKMMLPLLLIFAAVLVIVVGPLIVQLMGGM